MVLQKDVREFDSSCPPKADASLKPGEFEVGATEVVRSRAYLLSAVCGQLCTLTHLAENTRRVEEQRSFVCLCSGENAAVESSCHSAVYF